MQVPKSGEDNRSVDEKSDEAESDAEKSSASEGERDSDAEDEADAQATEEEVVSRFPSVCRNCTRGFSYSNRLCLDPIVPLYCKARYMVTEWRHYHQWQ